MFELEYIIMIYTETVSNYMLLYLKKSNQIFYVLKVDPSELRIC